MPYLDLPDGHIIRREARDNVPAFAHVIDEDSILAVNAALAIGRPLLVRGEPGTGKSQLAQAAAIALGRVFVAHAVDARTETRDLLYSIDAVARLAEAQLAGAQHNADPAEVRRRIHVVEFVQPGPLWWAFDWDSARAQAERRGESAPVTPEGWLPEAGAVVLIDEIDKADSAVPNGLLDALGHGRFDVQGREAVKLDRGTSPLVVLTTNEERALPDAFVRRCLVLHLSLPDKADALVPLLAARGKAHFEACSPRVLTRAAELLAHDRETLRKHDLAPPGLAEYIDLVGAVTKQRTTEGDQLDLLDRISKFALRKHPPEASR